MNKIVTIARREYLDKVRRKSFWIGIFITPLIWVVMGLGPSLLANKEDEHTKVIGIIDLTDSVTAPLQSFLDSKYKLTNGSPNYHLQELAVDKTLPPDTIRVRGDAQAMNDLVENYLYVGASIGAKTGAGSDTVEFRGTSVSSIRDGERLERALRTVVMDQQLRRRGIDVATYHGIDRDIDVRTIEISKSGESHEKGFLTTFGMSYVFIILLMMLTLMSGGMLVRSLVEEKSTRIIEVLFSSASPRQILGGKVLGLSSVGMTQLAVLAVLGFAVLSQMSFDWSLLKDIPLMMIYFILGYTMYTAIFVGIGSIVSTEQEAQQITGYLSILMVIPFTFIISAMQNPNDTVLRVLSQFPLFTPTFMLMRIPIHRPEWWELLLSIATMLLTIAGVVAVSGKVFRIAMLMYGKRPTLKELIRLART